MGLPYPASVQQKAVTAEAWCRFRYSRRLAEADALGVDLALRGLNADFVVSDIPTKQWKQISPVSRNFLLAIRSSDRAVLYF